MYSSFASLGKFISKYFILLDKEGKDLCTENYDTDERNWRWPIDGKIDHILDLEELMLSKWLYYIRQSTDSMQSQSKLFFFFYRTRTKKILKFVWKHKRYWIPKAILRERNRAKGIKLADQIMLQSPIMHILSLGLQQRRQWK